MSFAPGTIVKRVGDAEEGVVVSDPFSACSDQETPVVWDSSDDAYVGTPTEELVRVGEYDPRVADLKGCGAGQGEKCCKYLGVGTEGAECLRFGSFRYSIIFKKGMTANGSPSGIYPKCQEEIQASLNQSEGR